MILAFVSGPYRADTDWERYQNIERARNVAAELWRKGYAVICPHANTAFFSGVCDEQQFLDGGLEMVLRCDIIVQVDRTAHLRSSGTMKERAEADATGKMIYDCVEDVPLAADYENGKR